MNNIVLLDDYDNTLYCIIKTETSKAEIESIFASVKERLFGEWQIYDLLEELRNRGIKFSQEKFDKLYI